MIEPLDWTKCMDGAEDKLTQVRNVVCKLFDRVNMLVDVVNKQQSSMEQGASEMLDQLGDKGEEIKRYREALEKIVLNNYSCCRSVKLAKEALRAE